MPYLLKRLIASTYVNCCKPQSHWLTRWTNPTPIPLDFRRATQMGPRYVACDAYSVIDCVDTVHQKTSSCMVPTRGIFPTLCAGSFLTLRPSPLNATMGPSTRVLVFGD